ncbi:ABC-2 transporter permease [Fulvivirgaceae bacterium PWU4]|uniref:ABC-2 transporter permease n=1 Tax=Chryseosolibacter histidini TaxID=2782349 RepID=A0AAP2DF85_9BACT|nr:ABC transporter permease [Chryseosolibacter histidini]MBT1695296.1 ABC-2 transporter permease [Chryseosolibacter histidini]
MRTIRFLLEKEFRQIFRNKTLVAMIMVVPVVQLLILPLAANYEVKNINISIVNHDNSDYARHLITRITASGYFRLTSLNTTFDEALAHIESDEADLILKIPRNFEKNLVRENKQKLFVAVNAINGVKANLGGAYLATIIRDFNQDLMLEWFQPSRTSQQPVIAVTPTNWYNPYLNYRLFMVPGILAILVTMIGGYLSALNIVKEKEVGTIEQINVTPIRKHHFIVGKLIPFWVLGMVVFTLGLLVGWLAYGITPEGNLGLLYGFLALYLLAVLGLGLLISTYTDTQQQAMFIAFFFMMIFILMSGLFTSIDSMPSWAKVISRLNPVSYFIDVMRMVVLKGSGLADIIPHMGAVFVFAIVFNTWAIVNYRKTS